jgi:hypothetical protein
LGGLNTIDPQQKGLDQIDALNRSKQEAFFTGLGIGDLITVADEKVVRPLRSMLLRVQMYEYREPQASF